jgi:hypothetical protein
MPMTGELQKDLAKRSFHLQIKAIRPIDYQSTEDGLEVRPAKRRVSMLMKRIHLNATISDPESGFRFKSFHHQASLSGPQNTPTKEISVDAEPFVAQPDDFKLPIDITSPSSKRHGMASKYKLMISINFANTWDAEDTLGDLTSRWTLIRREDSSRWITYYENILSCPDQPQVLPLLYVADGAEKKPLELGLEVSMFFTSHPCQSLLEASSKRWKAGLADALSAARVQPSTKRPRIEVKFVYLQEELTYRDLACPHCGHHLYENVDDLYMHLRCFHDFFNYHPRKDTEADGVQSWIFECKVADHRIDHRASDRAPDPRDILIVAPGRPFDQRRYLETGSEDWQEEAQLRRPVRGPVPKVGISLLSRRQKHPDEIISRLAREKKRYRVPTAPRDVTFFRSFTKRPLAQGEYIGESDDEADMEWLRLKTDMQLINDAKIPAKAKAFIKGFNHYFREERLYFDLHLGDALVRFAEEKAAWISQESLEREFQQMLAEFSNQQIISQEIQEACLERVEKKAELMDALIERASSSRNVRSSSSHLPPQASLTPTGDSTPEGSHILNQLVNETQMSKVNDTVQRIRTMAVNKGGKGKEKANAADLSQMTFQPTDLEGDTEMTGQHEEEPSVIRPDLSAPATAYDKCICGQGAFVHGKRGIIHCENDVSHNSQRRNPVHS